MEMKDTPVSGGVTILHTAQDGKHHYEIETVLKDKRAKKEIFMRRGDKILKINGVDVEDLSPEMFAKMLSEGNPMLTVHQAGSDAPVVIHPEPGDMCPFNKEDTFLSLCLDLTTEPGDCDQVTLESECDQECDQEDENILMVVEMLDTSVSVVRGRGCAHGETCKDCGGTDCNLDEVVMMSSKISLVSRGIPSFLQDKTENNVALETLLRRGFVSRSSLKKTPAIKPKVGTAKITIYYYQSDEVDGTCRGQPVVLNFSGSDKFLRCSRHPDSNEVQVEVKHYEKSKLKCIQKTDDQSLAFVFYMTSGMDNARVFESANCEGWFIHAKDKRCTMSCAQKDDSFFFIIRGA
ncbi:interleukin-1 family member A [Engraulis encrasicolus]|uniref:interleukin-1 family member A n=1 Tax=Engraulis encrasicolus TaxID=184585 RepID=UPI002FD37627